MITKADLHLFTQYKSLYSYLKTHPVLIAFDTETTGTNCRQDKILEIGAYKFSLNPYSPYYSKPQIFDQLINPHESITPFISELTGITTEIAASGKEANEVLHDFLDFIDDENAILMAHNAPFDLYFIDNQLEKLNIKPLKNKCVDTLPLSRWAYPEFAKLSERGNYTLQNLAKKLEINVEAAHRAYDDAKVCAQLFKKIYESKINREEPLQGQLELIFETP